MSAEQATASPSEDDWDRSLVVQEEQPLSTPRNSVVFPAEDTPSRPTRFSSTEPREEGKRTLSELLRLHSEKGCNGKFSPEEASRIADVLGQWVSVFRQPVARGVLISMHRSTRLPRPTRVKTISLPVPSPRTIFPSRPRDQYPSSSPGPAAGVKARILLQITRDHRVRPALSLRLHDPASIIIYFALALLDTPSSVAATFIIYLATTRLRPLTTRHDFTTCYDPFMLLRFLCFESIVDALLFSGTN